MTIPRERTATPAELADEDARTERARSGQQLPRSLHTLCEQTARLIGCPYCGARPGQVCRRPGSYHLRRFIRAYARRMLTPAEMADVIGRRAGRVHRRQPHPGWCEVSGPFETSQQAEALPAVRAVYEAFARDPGAGKMQPLNLAMLMDACADAGVQAGAYDLRIFRWLAGWEPSTCAVIAGLIRRAAAGRDGGQR